MHQKILSRSSFPIVVFVFLLSHGKKTRVLLLRKQDDFGLTIVAQAKRLPGEAKAIVNS